MHILHLLNTNLTQLYPFFWGLFCVLLNFMSFHFLSEYHQSFPVVLIVIFYFAVLNPKKLNIFMVFILGLIADILTTAPFGINSFIFCFLFFISNLLRNYIKLLNYKYLWGAFVCLFFLTDIMWSWIFRLVSGIWVSASFWFVQFVFVCLFYPLFVWITGHLFPKEQGEL